MAVKFWRVVEELISNCCNLETSVVDVAVMYENTASPATDNLAYGEDVPNPKFPFT